MPHSTVEHPEHELQPPGALHPPTPEEQQCIDDCNLCQQMCLQTVPYCLAKGGGHAEPMHIQRLIECAETCRYAAEILALQSELLPRASDLCADACEKCADSCEALGEDERMQACAAVCRRVAYSCRPLAKM
jgi:hypothetical protein